MKEEWKDVVGFEGLYKVSNLGNVLRLPKTTSRITNGDIFYGAKLLSTDTYDKDGYVKTALRKDGKRHYLRVHRIVAEAFCSNPNNLPVVNHMNGKKNDNRAGNLEWCSISYNTKHAFDELGRKGQNGNTSKKVEMLNKHTKEVIRVFDSLKEASEFLGKTQSSAVWSALQDDSKTCGGYKWRYYNKGVTTIESATFKVDKQVEYNGELTPLEAQREM